METYQKFKVVMLPTEKASEGQLYLHNGVLNTLKKSFADAINRRTETNESTIKAQHLYILANQFNPDGSVNPLGIIKEGDWVYDIITGKIYQATPVVIHNMKSLDYEINLKKIVATTDKELFMSSIKNGDAQIALIPESFIQAYIKSYNEGKVIEEVDLKVEVNNPLMKYKGVDSKGDYIWSCKICKDTNSYMGGGNVHCYKKECSISKIKTRSDNTVIVHQSKMYSRDEVIELISKYGINKVSNPRYNIDTFIEDNL